MQELEVENLEIKELFEDIEPIKEKKRIGRPPKTAYDYYDKNKTHILKSMRVYPGQHLNKIIRYKIIFDNETYFFSTLTDIQAKFSLSYTICNNLLGCHTKLNNGCKLTKYQTKLISGYAKMTTFEKIEIDKSKKIIGYVSPTTDTNRCLNIDIPIQ